MKDFSGLDRLVDSFFEKRAELEKRADPPGKGLHDPNPAVAYAHRSYGFVPQVPWSYLSGANTFRDYDRVRAGIDEKVKPDQAQMFDYNRRSGAADNSMYMYDTRRVNPGFILLGSYPMNSDKIAQHEHGHYLDDRYLGFPRRKLYENTPEDTLYSENIAWDMAGVPEDDPVRQAAIKTYNLDVERENALNEANSESYPYDWDSDRFDYDEYDGATARNKSKVDEEFNRKKAIAFRALQDASASNWRPPGDTIKGFGGDVQIAYDYPSTRKLYASNPFASALIDGFNDVFDDMIDKERKARKYPPNMYPNGWSPYTGR